MIAEVIPLARLPKNLSFFDYEVPQNFEGQIKIGQIVRIPFRGKTVVSGLVIATKEKPAEKLGAVKPITKIIDFGENLDAKRLSLLRWLSDYYLVSPALVLKTFLPLPPQKASGFKSKPKSAAISLGVAKTDLEEIREKVRKISSLEKTFFLFHYQNYKNKTAVLLKIVEKIVGEGKNVLIFEPQIPDVVSALPYFTYLFPGKIAALHGEMSKTEYWQEWQKIKSGEAKIVIGTRSALFAPAQNVGLIIIDNEESPDFKQSDQNPRYDVREAMLRLGEFTGAKVIFTSQAPRPETYFFVKNYPGAEYLPPKTFSSPSTVVDMNDEIKNKNFSSLSEKLKEKISDVLEKKQKIVLLLNRRGLSTTILCRDCDYVFRCKNCQTPLACHDDDCNLPSQFVCHSCGAAEPVQLVCPKCRGTSIKYLGTGTQTVEKEIKKIFPKTKVLRIDRDAKTEEAEPGMPNVDIFIGTQFFVRNYLAKVKNIGLVGVVSADTLIYRPDFRSGEKTFSWLTDIVNLARETKSLAVIQTFFPNNFVVQAATGGKYDNFYKEELENRKMLRYPPFGKLIKLAYSSSEEKKCVDESARLSRTLLTALGERAEISYDEKPKKEKKKFFSKIIIKFSEEKTGLIREVFKKVVPDDWTIDIDPESLL